MSKKLIGLTLALALFAVAVPASAAGLTQAQISAIIGLLQSFGAEQSVINSVSVSLGGNSAGSPDNQKSCIQLTRNLTIGTTGEDVSRLQKYLTEKGFFSNEATGYYGFATAQAVGKLQISLGIVSSQNDSAYGMMGPKTRQAIGCGNIVEHPESSEKVFSATPTTGVAPLKVQFTSIYYATHDASETQHYVRFGDESKDLGRITCIKSNGSDLGSSRCLQWGVSHVYNTGTYTAELIRKVGSQATVLSTLPIVVSGSDAGDTQVKSFSATPTTGVAPLTVSFKVPYRSAGGDYFSFGDGTTGCAVPGTTNDYMTGCGVPINQTFTHTYTQPGTYKVTHSRLGPSTILGTATIAVGQSTPVVPVIQSITPSSGPVGTEVIIRGTGFTGQNTVGFGVGGKVVSGGDGTYIRYTIPSSVSSCDLWTDSSTICPPGAVLVRPSSYSISVSNANGTSESKAFLVTSGTAAPAGL